MSEAAIAPAEGGAGTTTPAAEGAAAQVLESGAVGNAPAPEPQPDRSEHNKWLIAQERERRKLAKEKESVEQARREAQAARDEAKKLAEQQHGEIDSMAQLVRSARGNPAKFNELLEATGLTMDDYVRWRVGEGEISPEQQIKGLDAALRDELKAARDEIKAIKEERDREKQEREQQTAAQRRAEAVAYFGAEIDKTLKADPDKYELTIASGNAEEVFRLIEGAYRTRGVQLTPAQAADMIEKHLRDTYATFEKTKFHQSKYAPTAPAPAPQTAGKPALQAKTSDAKQPASPTALTNNLVTSPAGPADAPKPLLSREEFIEQVARDRVRNAKKEAAAAKK